MIRDPFCRGKRSILRLPVPSGLVGVASGASPTLIFDGAEDMVHVDFKRNEVVFLSVSLGRVPCGLVYCSDSGSSSGNRLWFLFLPFTSSLEERLVAPQVASSICIYF